MNIKKAIGFILFILVCRVSMGNSDNLKHNAPVLKVANAIQSNMVVQQNKPFRIWGNASSGDRITIFADWMKRNKTVQADAKGNWLTAIRVPKAIRGDFNAHTITIMSSNDTIKLKNILIGEVWMCTGQSNMTFMMDSIKGWGPGVIDFKKEVAAADYPGIRLLKIGTALEDQPREESTGKWETCNPRTVRGFSAVAYYFGRTLFEKLQIPIGLVANGIPGAACQSFTNRMLMEADAALTKKYLIPYDTIPRKKGESIFLTLSRPSLIYNGMIYPIRHLSIRGIIWYQGNANVNDGMIYNQLSTVMLEGWRKDFDQGALPFYLVQMPPYNFHKHDPTADNLALFREVQTAILKIKNTGMAVTMDSKEFDNLHPRDKKPVGIRLAKVALHKTYQMKDIQYRGPVFKKYKTDQDTVRLSFETASIGNGLTTSNGRPPEYFFVAGSDKVFHAAKAKIVGDQVWVYSPDVHHPVAVRYAFTNYPVTNFENKEGLPAWPFRTDHWE